MINIPDSVFPKDAEGNFLCPQCQKKISLCGCPAYEPPKPKARAITPIIRLDKSGRKGKIVTVIKNLPRDDAYLKNLAKTIKMKTGSGGTSYVSDEGGVIEIQGDHALTIKLLLSRPV